MPADPRGDDAPAPAPPATTSRTVIAGYHWFTDWGRDTMICLEGLTLPPAAREARDILRTFAHHVRDGLIPNLFPGRRAEGLYHTADATLWFFHALDRYVTATGDQELLRSCCRRCRTSCDPSRRDRASASASTADGLLRQGAEGYQLTWMDAKVDDWVVTPRRGKAVEINALWYNALVCSPAGSTGRARRRARRSAARSAPRCRSRSTRGSGTRRRGTSSTSSTASRATTTPAGRISSSPSRCRTRCSTAQYWQAVLESVRASCSRRSGCARWRRRIPTTSATTSATCARATPPITRARCGRG